MQIFFKIFSFCQKNGVKLVRKICQQLSTIGHNYFGVVNNYRQLATICERLFKGSTIINN